MLRFSRDSDTTPLYLEVSKPLKTCIVYVGSDAEINACEQFPLSAFFSQSYCEFGMCTLHFFKVMGVMLVAAVLVTIVAATTVNSSKLEVHLTPIDGKA